MARKIHLDNAMSKKTKPIHDLVVMASKAGNAFTVIVATDHLSDHRREAVFCTAAGIDSTRKSAADHSFNTALNEWSGDPTPLSTTSRSSPCDRWCKAPSGTRQTRCDTAVQDIFSLSLPVFGRALYLGLFRHFFQQPII